MATNTFWYFQTLIFHGTASGAVPVCRLVYFTSGGLLALCPSATRPDGVAPATYADGDIMGAHRLGQCFVETDGTAGVGTYIKAAADGSGKGVLDSAPGIVTAGKVLSLDATTNIAKVQLFI